MLYNLTQKIISAHLLEGEMIAGSSITIRVDQTLFQDALGTMACLQYEAMGFDRPQTELSITYVDHNMLQTGFENAEDQLFLQTFCAKHGIFYSPAGNGICHQVHLERFGQPGKTLLGTDSHTPTNGGLGMLSIGAGGLDVATAMGTGRYCITMPRVIEVRLRGRLQNRCSAKDLILQVLRTLSVKGGIGAVMEYTGEGVKSLSVYERATIANMGAELGATSSIFPSDERTLEFLRAQQRPDSYQKLCADPGALYDGLIDLDLDTLVPLAACPHSPDNVTEVTSLPQIRVDQVCIGSCTNSSYIDMMRVAHALEGKRVAPGVSLVISPGSRQVLNLLAKNGALSTMIRAGARILECACGPCIGMGQAPRHGAVSLRTFNRNFEKRSGTDDAQVYLVSPETAVISALAGFIKAGENADFPTFPLPTSFEPDDSFFVRPQPVGTPTAPVFMGENIKPFPVFRPLPQDLSGKVLIKLGNHITTDHIVPGGAAAVPFRSNVPYLAGMTLVRCDPQFPQRACQHQGGFIVAGENYGQGSSREHAAMVLVELGVRAVIAKDFARIHRANLVNCGVLPLVFADPEDYGRIDLLDELTMQGIAPLISDGQVIWVRNHTKEISIALRCDVPNRERAILLAGGIVNLFQQNDK